MHGRDTILSLLTIVRKEFTDLIGSKVVVITLIVYLVLVALVVYSFYYSVTHFGFSKPGERLVGLTFNLVQILVEYGSILAVVIGFTSVWNETRNSALGVLAVKPIRRNTIILGKLIGALMFMFCLSVLSVLAYVSGLLILTGNITGSSVEIFLGWIPAILALALVCDTIFLLLAMLFALMTRDVILSLFLGVLSWIILNEFIPNIAFAGNLSLLFGPDQEAADSFFNSLSPLGSVNQIFLYVKDNANVWTTIADGESIVLRLIIMLVALLALNYILFARRDIS
jgi:ABC-type transport system involved in multi-copper enzyme maturation permease subunit